MKRLSDCPVQRLADCRGEAFEKATVLKEMNVRYGASSGEAVPLAGDVEDPNSAWEDTFGPDYEDDSEPVEVAAILSTDPKERNHYFTPDELARFNKCYPKQPAKSYTIELVDRAHVNRLTAENDAIRLQAGGMQMTIDELTAERDRVQGDKDRAEAMLKRSVMVEDFQALQSELTKARELNSDALLLLNQFMPNAHKCFGIDFSLLNQTMIGLAKQSEKGN